MVRDRDDLFRRVSQRVREGDEPKLRPYLKAPLVYPVASPALIAAAERELAFALPDFLKTLYTQLGNGWVGSGPGVAGFAGLLCKGDSSLIPNEKLRGEQDDAVAVYRSFSSAPGWPGAMLPICDWGCAMWSCVLCDEDDFPVYRLGDDVEGPFELDVFAIEADTIEDWFEQWLRLRSSGLFDAT